MRRRTWDKGPVYRELPSGILVPTRRAVEIGFGCPKCDESELVPVAGNANTAPPTIIAFLRKHKLCNVELDMLEKYSNGEMIVSGKLDPKKPGVQKVDFAR